MRITVRRPSERRLARALWAEDRAVAGLNVHTHEHGHGHAHDDASDHEHHDDHEDQDHGHEHHGAAEDVGPIETLIRSRRRLDARMLADPGEDLAELARTAGRRAG